MPDDKKCLRPPVGLELETVAEAFNKAEANEDEASKRVEKLEFTVRRLHSSYSEREVAASLKLAADVLEVQDDEVAECIVSKMRQRATGLVAKELNQLDGFDR